MEISTTNRSLPNILICGTPTTGKTLLCSKLYQVNCSIVALQKDTKYNKRQKKSTVDQSYSEYVEKRLCGKRGGYVLDDFLDFLYPERCLDAIFVLRTEQSILRRRLENFDYDDWWISGVVEQEREEKLMFWLRHHYRQVIIHEFPSDTVSDLENNVESICKWMDKFHHKGIQEVSD